ncbi:MAG TPA: glutamate--cysteine ligase [Jatrophihabitantaceae bacterium]|jgi:carboxylate-amine ligase
MRMVGVEEELLLVDARASRAKPAADQVVAEARDSGDEGSQFEREFKREQVETATPPCESAEDLRSELTRLRAEMAKAAATQDANVAALATNPLPGWPTPTNEHRYEEMIRQFGLLAHLQLTCAQHVHVSIASKDEGVGVLDRIRPWLAVLTALSANSPFWLGEDTGYASYRTMLWGQWPTAGANELFGDADTYERTVADLLASETMLDRGMVYFDARLSATYPTVEIRVADVCQHVDDAVAIALLSRALVDTAARDWHAGRPPADVRVGLLRAATWRAARSGMTGDLVDLERARAVPAWTLVDRLLEHVWPALQRYGDDQATMSALGTIRERGTGARQQRVAFAEREELADVVADAVLRTGES